MSITITDVSSNQNFGVWLTRHNQMSEIISSNTVTADASNTGSITTGNSYVNGYMTAVHLVANGELRGGTANNFGPLFVSSNAFFQYNSANVFIVASTNNTFSNVTVNSTNFSVVSNNSTTFATNTIIAGAHLYVNTNATSFLRTVGFSNTITVTGNVTFSNTANLVGAVSMMDTLSVTNAVSFSNTLGVTGNTNLTNALNVTGNTVLSNTLYVTGNAVFSNTANVIGLMTAANLNTNVANASNVNATVINIPTGAFYANATTVNSAIYTVGTIGAANGYYANATTIAVGNSSVNTIVTPANVSTNTLYCYNMSVTGYIVGTFTAQGNILPLLNNLQFVGNSSQTFASLYSTNVYTNSLTSQSGDIAVNSNSVFSANVTFNSRFNVNSAVTFANTLSVNGAVTFGNTLTVTNSATFSNTISVAGAATFSNTISVTNSATFSNTISVAGAANLQSSVGIGGSANIAGTLLVNTNFGVTGTIGSNAIPTTTATYWLGNNSLRWIVSGSNGSFSNALSVSTSTTVNTTGVFTTSINASSISIGNTTTYVAANSSSIIALSNGTIGSVITGNNQTANGTGVTGVAIDNGFGVVASATGANSIGLAAISNNFVGVDARSNNGTALNVVANSAAANVAIFANSAGVAAGLYGNGNFGIANTSPTNKLTVGGTAYVSGNATIIGQVNSNNIAYQVGSSFTFTNTTIAIVDSFPTSSFRAAEYLISMSSGTNFHSSKILVLHDGSTTYMTEYGALLNNVSLGLISSTISAGNLNLQITPTNANVAVKIVRNAVSI
jgi:hypothetical protein